MKKPFVLILFAFIIHNISAQEEEAKDGWNFGALPVLSFNSDLGFQYGALVNLFDYGDGNNYPGYDHSLYFELSKYTKGSGLTRFYYDSNKLFKNLQTSVDVSYMTDDAYDFYGYNGYEAVVNYNWMDDAVPEYKTRMFYKYSRKLFRFKLDLQGKLKGDNFRWIGGLNLLNFKVGRVDIEKLNEGKDEGEQLPSHEEQPGLFEKYNTDFGIISDKEANGGFVPLLKAGVVYDTRDNRPNPMKGIWTEAVLVGAPEFLGCESSFSKLSFIHRQYFTIIPKDLSFAYRLSYQTTLGGQVPFYYQSQVIASVLTGSTSEGLGGSKTLRGVKRNRIVGDGFFFGNLEARWKFARFRLMNNNFYLGLNGFMDFGRVTKKLESFENLAVITIAPNPLNDYYDADAEKLHVSYGLGFKAAMNQNFILSLDYGVSADARDGDSGIYIGLNYLF